MTIRYVICQILWWLVVEKCFEEKLRDSMLKYKERTKKVGGCWVLIYTMNWEQSVIGRKEKIYGGNVVSLPHVSSMVHPYIFFWLWLLCSRSFELRFLCSRVFETINNKDSDFRVCFWPSKSLCFLFLSSLITKSIGVRCVTIDSIIWLLFIGIHFNFFNWFDYHYDFFFFLYM